MKKRSILIDLLAFSRICWAGRDAGSGYAHGKDSGSGYAHSRDSRSRYAEPVVSLFDEVVVKVSSKGRRMFVRQNESQRRRVVPKDIFAGKIR